MMGATTKQRLDWLRVNDEEEIGQVDAFVKTLKVNTCSNIKKDRNLNSYVLLGTIGHDGFEGNHAAIWFKTEELAEQGKAIVEHLIGVSKQ